MGASKPACGFTLVELLLTLFIISIMASLAVISFSNNLDKALSQEAQRLQAVIDMAIDEAIAQSAELTLIVDDNGYRFAALSADDGKWVSIKEKPFSDYPWPEAISVSVNIDGSAVDAQAMAQLKQWQNAAGDISPMLLFLSSGELLPFTIELRHDDSPNRRIIASDGIHPVEVLP